MTQNMTLPNIRKIFVPDPGYTFFDLDLDSADLRIVQRESSCRQLKTWFDDGLKPYVELAKEFYHDQTITKHHPKYNRFKSLCHATNYLGQPRSIATQPNIGLPLKDVELVQKWYFTLCPEIKEWHERLISGLNRTATITNAFGYRRQFMDRIDNAVYREAAAWIPQSTVGIVINHAYANIHKNLPTVQVLLQVHDSLAGQYPTRDNTILERILQESRITVPYPDPLIIPTGIKTSTISWGHCE
jgi:DNA polymerase I-like protein with 3'-5' exonuclease and polymerase domains